mmetsp:Transcript_33890/g.63285  ORF Transcript_33890/g.63285 Transcript_33890/m.63285 type:complete len:201 (-) Transcript_33890:518-1120(-)
MVKCLTLIMSSEKTAHAMPTLSPKVVVSSVGLETMIQGSIAVMTGTMTGREEGIVMTITTSIMSVDTGIAIDMMSGPGEDTEMMITEEAGTASSDMTSDRGEGTEMTMTEEVAPDTMSDQGEDTEMMTTEEVGTAILDRREDGETTTMIAKEDIVMMSMIVETEEIASSVCESLNKSSLTRIRGNAIELLSLLLMSSLSP